MKSTKPSFRTLKKVFASVSTSEGAGVQLYRSIGAMKLQELDPFLLLDEFKSDNPDDYIAGFPDHPHRGFETVTYMIEGSMLHKDSNGNEGRLESGDIQWMTAGKGIVHSEMPQQKNGLLWGFQLWVNLPSADKMKPPRYQDISKEKIPVIINSEGVEVRIIAGKYEQTEGAVEGIAIEPLYLDVYLPENRSFSLSLPEDHQAFVYPFAGALNIGENADGPSGKVPASHIGILEAGNTFSAYTADNPSRFLLIAGKPINEPIVRYGPFVMNTDAEIEQAIVDFRQGMLI